MEDEILTGFQVGFSSLSRMPPDFWVNLLSLLEAGNVQDLSAFRETPRETESSRWKICIRLQNSLDLVDVSMTLAHDS